jgi:hypothetical protein
MSAKIALASMTAERNVQAGTSWGAATRLAETCEARRATKAGLRVKL